MSKIDDLMYHAGLTAQGSLDSMDDYDRQAIDKLVKLVAKECMDIIVQNRNYAKEHHWPASETANVCLYEIEQTFGVNEDGKETISG